MYVRCCTLIGRTHETVLQEATQFRYRARIWYVICRLFNVCKELTRDVKPGMTEVATAVTFPQIDMKVGTPGSAGQLLAGVVCRVLKRDGTWAGYNESGELITKTPSAALCYYNNTEA